MKKLLAATFFIIFMMMPVTVFAQSYNGATIEPENDGKTYNVSADVNDQITLNNVGGNGGTLKLGFTGAASGSVVVQQTTTRPADAPVAPGGSVDIYFDVQLTGGLTSNDIGSGTWTFTVDKSFINGIDGAIKDNVFLNHYNGTAWERLVTRQVSETATTYVYEAEVTDFSPFAVTAVLGLTNTGSPYMMGMIVAVVSLVVVGVAYRFSRNSSTKVN